MRRFVNSVMHTIHLEQALRTNQWDINDHDGLTLIQSPLLAQYKGRLTHAFTTRVGPGDARGPYDFFNLGRNVPDEAVKRTALANRERLCAVLGADHAYLKVPGQVHSGTVVPILEATAKPDMANVDGVSTNLAAVPLLLHFADCVPVIIYEKKKELLSIVHAGWRGTAQAIAANAVKLMIEEWGGDVSQMVAAVGPAIGTCCYPTGEDVVEQLMLTLSLPLDGSLVQAQVAHGLVKRESIQRRQELQEAIEKQNAPAVIQPRPDLKAFNAMQLLLAGVPEVDVCSFCTACRPDLFYSHRQSGGKTGRQGAIAMLHSSTG
ncbi:MAG: polyphenol oxidase family protein [Candidatus Melainabacteria bacterium]|nr:polyphenol oxidase family protein [Candidatus Melainabacteria bacterium]